MIRTVIAAAALALVCVSDVAIAQQPQAAPPVTRLVIEPDSLVLKVGETTTVKVTALDAAGNPVADPTIRVVGSRRALAVSRTGQVRAIEPGRHEIVASSSAYNGAPITTHIPVIVSWPNIARLEIASTADLHVGVTVAHKARGINPDGSERTGLAPTWRSSDPGIAGVDQFGYVTAYGPGRVTISATAQNVTARKTYTVTLNPVARIELGIAETHVRTGDVVHLKATAKRANGTIVAAPAITWSYSYTPDDTTVAPGAAGIIDDGMFAANHPGLYELIAQSGTVSARKTISVAPRDVRRRINIVGRGAITNQHTTDLWPWTGLNGRDYVIVGDGWIKDGDYNSTFSKTVLPLPYHAKNLYDTPPGRLEDLQPHA